MLVSDVLNSDGTQSIIYPTISPALSLQNEAPTEAFMTPPGYAHTISGAQGNQKLHCSIKLWRIQV